MCRLLGERCRNKETSLNTKLTVRWHFFALFVFCVKKKQNREEKTDSDQSEKQLQQVWKYLKKIRSSSVCSDLISSSCIFCKSHWTQNQSSFRLRLNSVFWRATFSDTWHGLTCCRWLIDAGLWKLWKSFWNSVRQTMKMLDGQVKKTGLCFFVVEKLAVEKIL